ncbi:MAG: O-antigen ligase family protein [Pseudomonadota bacterium]
MASIASLKALIVVLVALTIAFAIRPRFDKDQLSLRVLIFWGWAAISVLAFEIPFIRMFFLGIGLLACAPQKLEHKAPFILCCFIAVPVEAGMTIPFPGINYLIDLNFLNLIFLMIGLPILLGMGKGRKTSAASPNTGPNTSFTDGLLVLLMLSTWLLDMRAAEATITTSMRELLVNMLAVILPYFAISRGMLSAASLRALATTLIAISTHLITVGVITYLIQWNVYMEVAPSGVKATTNSRGSGIRVVLTTAHAMAGLMMTVSAMALWFKRKQSTTLKFVTYALLPGALFILVATLSRGALLAAMVAFATLIFCRIQSKGLRGVLVVGAVVFLGIAVPFALSGDVSQLDEHGTFSYRQDLLREGIGHVRDHPIFGQADFMTDPRFEYLRQGQGIIDFTNGYLQYALRWGMVGLGLFLILNIRTGLSLVRSADRFKAKGHDDLAAITMGVVATQAGYLAMIATISLISFIGIFGIILLGLGSAISSLSKTIPAVGDERDETTPPPLPPVEKTNKQTATPHHAPTSDSFVPDVTPGVKGWPI